MKAMYRRHCLLKRRWWEKYTVQMNRRLVLKMSAAARDVPYGQQNPPRPHLEKEEQTLGVRPCKCTSMDTWWPQGAPLLPPGSRGHANGAGRGGFCDSHGKEGCSSRRRCSCRTMTLRSPRASQGSTRRKEACGTGHDASAPS